MGAQIEQIIFGLSSIELDLATADVKGFNTTFAPKRGPRLGIRHPSEHGDRPPYHIGP